MGRIELLALICLLGYVHGQNPAPGHTVEISPKLTEKYLLVGSPLTLTCRYSYPKDATMEQVDFYKGGPNQLISENNDYGFERTMKQEMSSSSETTTILNINKNVTTLQDGGLYECRLSSSNANADITVHIFQINSKNDELVAGSKEPLMLQCLPDVQPQATSLQVIWKHNNATLTDDDKYDMYDKNASLVINNPARSDMGEYRCDLIFNPDSSVERHEVTPLPLSVKAAPKVDSHDNNKNMVQGDAVELHCTVSGYPIPTVSWTKDGQKVNSSVRHHFLPYGGTETGMLKIFALEFEDEGSYACLAENTVSPFNSTAQIRLRVKDKLAALWPFLGIVLEVVVLCIIILVYEKRRSKKLADEDDAADNNVDNTVDHKDVRHRRT